MGLMVIAVSFRIPLCLIRPVGFLGPLCHANYNMTFNFANDSQKSIRRYAKEMEGNYGKPLSGFISKEEQSMITTRLSPLAGLTFSQSKGNTVVGHKMDSK